MLNTLYISMRGVFLTICVVGSLLTGCNVSHSAPKSSDGPTFPWDFPSACGLSSVTCDNGDLEVDLERALAQYIVCEHKAPKQVCKPEAHDCRVVSYCGDESAAVIKAGVAANRYLAGLTSSEQLKEASLAQYLAWALGGKPEGYPLSERDLTDMGYIE